MYGLQTTILYASQAQAWFFGKVLVLYTWQRAAFLPLLESITCCEHQTGSLAGVWAFFLLQLQHSIGQQQQ